MKLKPLLICALAAATASLAAKSLRDAQDSERVLFNPDKGWYHHYYDNTLGRYLGSDESIAAIPNMHHLFLRFAWSFLEPEEGKFNWALIDDIAGKWYPRGVKVSLSITCNETGIKYATPKWVFDAGAKGNIVKARWGDEIVEPQIDDPVFMEKLENLHRAIAARYDGKPFIVDMTLASLGNWGEGHYSASSHIKVPLEAIKKHIDLYKRCYKRSRLTIGDDWIGNNLDGGDLEEGRKYVVKNGLAYRDDSILVEWHYFAKVNKGKDSLLRPEFFDDIYPYAPGTIELEHYKSTLKSGSWKGRNGSEEGAAALRRALKRAHCTYLGYHGYADEYARDNPEFLREMANKVGYWYFINSADFDPKTGRLTLEWENRGMAHAFKRYALFVKIRSCDGKFERVFPIASADNRKWEPDTPVSETYAIPVGDLPSGEYAVSVLLKKTSPKGEARPIELGFKEELRDSGGFYKILKFEK
ncbi:MAG: hypothetical protein BHW65_06455 [Verrucomicrobia bacterium CAG:312_58_20]|nr:MAG: hypothetical protein BHW65_06455 [Verrucomicrobia bacterium CAG:312_58_20]